MNFYEPETIVKIKSIESDPQVYKNVFTSDEINTLISIENEYEQERMVDRTDSRKTKIEQQSRVSEIITPKLEKTLGSKINIGDFPAHFIKSRFPLRIHADMGKDKNLIPHKNILIPLYVNGDVTTHTLLFKQKWYGKSSLFSADAGQGNDHFFKDMHGEFIHVANSDDLLVKMSANFGKEISYNKGTFFCNEKTVGEIKALLKQSRYSDRTNKHITSNTQFDKHDYEKYLTHQPFVDLTGLELDVAIAWHPGDVIVFDRSTIHCASNFLAEGVDEKMAIAMFTVWKEQ